MMSVISSWLTHATKMERGTLVTFLDTNGNDARNGEIFIFFSALAFTHSFAPLTCKLGHCKLKVKTA